MPARGIKVMRSVFALSVLAESMCSRLVGLCWSKCLGMLEQFAGNSEIYDVTILCGCGINFARQGNRSEYSNVDQ